MNTTMGSLQIVPHGDREVVMTRTFNAPPHAVFEAFTKPEFVRNWLLGPPGWAMPVCEMDVRVGGNYRWVWRKDKTGEEMGLSGTFREVSPPQRLVHTERWDQAWYGAGEAVITTEFAERDGKTALTVTILHASKEAREQMLKSGMEKGVAASYDRLEEMLASK